MKTQLDIGDKIQRFEVMLTKEYDSLYEIISVTKTLAKTENKVFQRIVDEGKGDCMKCAIATLLGLDYEEVPHFLEFENPNSEMADFMMEKGFEYDGVLYNYPGSEYSDIHKLKDCEGINGLFYASVFSPKYYKKENGISGHQIGHAVLINKNFEIVFDPNVKYQDLEKYPASDELGYNGVKNVYLFSSLKAE